MSKDRTVNRRGFFREGFRELLRPIAELAEPMVEEKLQIPRSKRQPNPKSQIRNSTPMWLRPPGALPEREFLDTCSRCGDCVNVCPAQCIRIDASSSTAGGAPHIVAESMPCVVCDTLACMHACPTGALSPIPLHEIDMGTAVWNERSCIRTEGEECTICIDRCPLGSAAIELRDDRVHVIEEGCIGCGVCEYYCPTRPRSIVVAPREE